MGWGREKYVEGGGRGGKDAKTREVRGRREGVEEGEKKKSL